MEAIDKILSSISQETRIKGCSNKDALSILLFLAEIPDNVWNHYEIYEQLRGLLFDELPFTAVSLDGKKLSRGTVLTTLPNGIYKKILVYLILNTDKFSSSQLRRLYSAFIHMEEAAITGYIYVSIHGASFELILERLKSYQIEPEIQFYVDALDRKSGDRVQKGLILSNTVIVFYLDRVLKSG